MYSKQIKWQLIDFYLLAKRVTFPRFANGIKLFASYFLSLINKKPIVWNRPLAASIEPTNRCNLNCIECPTGLETLTRKSGQLSLSDFEQILPQLLPQIWHINLYFQGEPMLNSELPKIIQSASQKNIYTCFSTNGHYLTASKAQEIVLSGLDKIIISLDGMTSETYQKYRKGGDFQKVISGIETLLSAKKELKSTTPVIEIQLIVFKHNEHEIEEFKRFCNVREVSFALKSAQIENDISLLTSIEKYRRYKIINNQLQLKHPPKNRCFRLWESIVLTHNLQLATCCYDKNADMLKTTSSPLDDWKNGAMQGFRNQILTNKMKVDICRNCNQQF